MSTTTCSDCGSAYNSESVSIPNPIPDKMCATCGTILTDAEISALLETLN